MKAIILAAGYATRLYPLTVDRPKALLEINGKAIVDYIIDELNTLDVVDEIILVSNHKFADVFRQWADRENPKPIHVLDDGTASEETRKGAIGDIYFTLTEKGIDDDVIIIAGDNFFTYTLKNYYDYYQKLEKDCVCAKKIGNHKQLHQFAVALLNGDNKIIDLEEKPKHPKSDIAVFATYIYRRETLPLFKQYLAEGNKPDAPGYFVQWLYKRKEVYAYIMDGDCYDIGTPESYHEVQALYQKP